MSEATKKKLLELIEEFRAKAREKKPEDVQAQFYEAYAAGISRAIIELKKEQGEV